MILLADEMDLPGVRNAEGFRIPAHVPVQRPAGLGRSYRGAGGAGSSAQTRLSWSYVVEGHSIKSGTLTWPTDYNAAGKDHGVQLLRIAEDALVPGCPPARLPGQLDFGGAKPGVSSLDAARQSLRVTHQELLSALEQLRAGRVCRRSSR